MLASPSPKTDTAAMNSLVSLPLELRLAWLRYHIQRATRNLFRSLERLPRVAVSLPFLPHRLARLALLPPARTLICLSSPLAGLTTTRLTVADYFEHPPEPASLAPAPLHRCVILTPDKPNMASSTRPLLVDVHTHMCVPLAPRLAQMKLILVSLPPLPVIPADSSFSYPPTYMNLLRRREQIPKVVKNNEGNEMVVLLKEEEGKGANSKGRPVGPSVARSLVNH